MNNTEADPQISHSDDHKPQMTQIDDKGLEMFQPNDHMSEIEDYGLQMPPTSESVHPYQNFAAQPHTHFFNILIPLPPNFQQPTPYNPLNFPNLLDSMPSEESKPFQEPFDDLFMPKTPSKQSKNTKRSTNSPALKPGNSIKTSEKTTKSKGFFELVINFLLVRKFIQKTRGSLIFRPENPNKLIQTIINDKSALPEAKSILLLSNISDFFYKIPVLKPDSALIPLFQLFFLIIIFIYLLLMPLEIGFGMPFIPLWVKYLSIGVFVGELMLGMNVACFNEKGDIESDRYDIIREYAKKTLFFPVFSLFLLVYRGNCKEVWCNLALNAVFFSILLKTAIKKWRMLVLWLDFSLQRLKNVDFLCFLYRFFLLAHVFACLWLFSASFTEEYKENWLIRGNYANSSASHQYFLALLNVLLMLTTVGLLDKPETTAEKTVVFLMLSSLIVLFSCFLSYHYMEKQENIPFEACVNGSKIDFLSKLKIKDYFSKKKNLCGDKTMDFVFKLKEIEVFNRNVALLKGIPLFSKYFSSSFIEKITSKAENKEIFPGEQLKEEESCTNNVLFVILEGKMQVFLKDRPKTAIFSIIKPDLFPIASFLRGKNSEFEGKAIDFCRVLVIKRDIFMEIVKENPVDYESFCFLRDKLELYGESIDFSCHVCGLKGHNLLNCGKTHLSIIKSSVVSRQNISFYPKRADNPKKRMKKTLHALRDFGKIKDAASNLFPESSSGIEIESLSSNTSKSLNEDKIMQKIKLDVSSEFTLKDLLSSSYSCVDNNNNNANSNSNSNNAHNTNNNDNDNDKDNNNNDSISGKNLHDTSICSFDPKSETSLGRVIHRKNQKPPSRINKIKSNSLINLTKNPNLNEQEINRTIKNETFPLKLNKNSSFSENSSKKGKKQDSSNLPFLPSIIEDEEEKESENNHPNSKLGKINSSSSSSSSPRGMTHLHRLSALFFENNDSVFESPKDFQLYFPHNNPSVVQTLIIKRNPCRNKTSKILFEDEKTTMQQKSLRQRKENKIKKNKKAKNNKIT